MFKSLWKMQASLRKQTGTAGMTPETSVRSDRFVNHHLHGIVMFCGNALGILRRCWLTAPGMRDCHLVELANSSGNVDWQGFDPVGQWRFPVVNTLMFTQLSDLMHCSVLAGVMSFSYSSVASIWWWILSPGKQSRSRAPHSRLVYPCSEARHRFLHGTNPWPFVSSKLLWCCQ
jgi:hypothetical protein